MFSTNELISFVFANNNDLYFGSDLLTLDLNQHLWMTLHDRYKTVYFLKAAGEAFSVTTYGDLSGEPFKPDSGRLHTWLRNRFSAETPQDQFANWLLAQLCKPQGEAVAFVCPLEDFCYTLSLPSWTPLLTRIANAVGRTGSFVLTADAIPERTRDLLLSCPVFETLRDTAVMNLRSGGQRELYDSLFRSKQEGQCLFLNAFTYERLRSLLLHLCIRIPDRFDDLEAIDQLTYYLHTYLHDPNRQLTEPLEDFGIPAACMSYRELYDLLARPSIWRRLHDRASCFVQTGRLPELHFQEAPVHRDRNSYAGVCMTLRLPQWLNRSASEDLPAIYRTLLRIRKQVCAPKNQTENETVCGAAAKFLNQLDSVAAGDVETYKLILDAVAFCVDWAYLSPDADESTRVNQILDSWSTCIPMSQQCFQSQRNLSLQTAQSDAGMSAVYRTRLIQAQNTFKLQRKNKEEFLGMIRAAIVELDLIRTIPITNNIVEQMAQMQRSRAESYADDAFEFTMEDYSSRPPM